MKTETALNLALGIPLAMSVGLLGFVVYRLYKLDALFV